MCRILKQIMFLILFLLFSSPFVSGGRCTPYETYSITSVLQGDGYAFIVIHHSEWVCEEIAGEETLRRNMPDGEYDLYYLFNGSDLLFLGKSNPLLGEPSIGTKINGTFYILQLREETVPYGNVMMIVNGEARNFTITASKTEMRVYRFDGCADLVWNCTKAELQNGTVVSDCTESPVLDYFFREGNESLEGIRGEINDGFVTFPNLNYKIPVSEFERYFSDFFDNKGLSKVLSALYALPVDGGILIYYPGEIRVEKSGFLSELPLVLVGYAALAPCFSWRSCLWHQGRKARRC
ncbi:MAG: hypothetical protein PWQ95_1416 [Thermococcaceae archaeon]|nr:hypothetical protein [Thermococcaceae archaeon]